MDSNNRELKIYFYEVNKMKFRKLALGTFIAVLSTGFLFGCATPNDEQEPDPTEEPSEQHDQGENELEEEQNQ